jgi:hypothetical protein
MIGVNEDALGKINQAVYEWFASQGSTKFLNLQQGEHFAFITVKG